MKSLIYLACFIPYAIITTILSVNGIKLGGIPTVLLTMPFFFAARLFSRLYAEKKEAKEASKLKDEEK